MHNSAIDLKEFYGTLQGKVVRRILRQHIRVLWPDVKGLRVVGLGYATPYLRPFLGEAERLVALMPMRQGAVFWPPESDGLVGLCDEEELPIEANSVDRLLVIHTLDNPGGMDAVLQEAWRVLAGQGRLLLVVPNRSGIWARMDNTPFGRGTPYSIGQMRQSLKEHMFVPESAERALFFPPAASRLVLTTSGAWEKVGGALFNAFGGVNIVEASKQLYAGMAVGVTAAAKARKRFMPAPKPVVSSNRRD
ncbi:MAG: methyltransferase type 11 [Alphaproteobacteria bacterium]|nr:methyltransferase type 11 [Alphaproteobacteria bacterium]MDE2335722.1 methyltransferase type 11 [Alphaproteobacteria bacterium]